MTRVFQIKANAVICIKDSIFELIDALGNLWCRTSDEVELLNNIVRLYKWTESSSRKESMKSDAYVPYTIDNIPDLKDFCKIIRSVSDKVENERGGRYFGNASTRCSKMFPSIRSKVDDNRPLSPVSKLFQYILVSKRNISKDKIQPEDFIVSQYGGRGDSESTSVGKILYYGDDKPSVDTPSQIWLYNDFPKINYMIHGHSYINCKFLDLNLVRTTEKYCSCGDIREVGQIKKIVTNPDCDFFIVNLTNHGFIIATDTLERMRDIVEHNDTSFVYRKIGEEIPKL